jgi:transposase
MPLPFHWRLTRGNRQSASSKNPCQYPRAAHAACHPTHRAKIVADYVQSLEGELELHFLPGYAPDLNPDEFVWNYMRLNGTSKIPLRKNESLKARVNNDLAAIRRSPALVPSFFMADSVVYIMN